MGGAPEASEESMTTEELLGQLYDQTLVGNKPAVLELTNPGWPWASARRRCCTRP